MKINMNRRGFLKVTGAAAATTAVAPAALANVGDETYYVECVNLNGPPKVQYYNRDSERFKAFIADRPDNWRLYWNLSRKHMADNLGEHVVEFFDAHPENYILSSSPGNPLAFAVSNYRLSESYANGLVIEKIKFKENHKVWGLS
jgi:hypothetical protein